MIFKNIFVDYRENIKTKNRMFYSNFSKEGFYTLYILEDNFSVSYK